MEQLREQVLVERAMFFRVEREDRDGATFNIINH